jgi:flagellar motor switch protein FliN/FliY
MSDDPSPAPPDPATSTKTTETRSPSAGAAPADSAPVRDGPIAPSADTGASADFADQAAIDELLKQASFDDATSATAATGSALPEPGAGGSAAAVLPEGTAPFDLPSFNQVLRDAQVSSIELLRDVDLNVKIELGRSRMLVEDVLKLAEGSVVELDKLAGDPVDVFVNDRLVARGEVLVLNDNFCVRVNEIVAGLKEEGV